MDQSNFMLAECTPNFSTLDISPISVGDLDREIQSVVSILIGAAQDCLLSIKHSNRKFILDHRLAALCKLSKLTWNDGKMQGVLPTVCYTVRNKMHHLLLNNMSLPVEHEEKGGIFKNVTYSLRRVIINGFVF